MTCDHDWRGGWQCQRCWQEDRRGPRYADSLEKRVAELERALRRLAAAECDVERDSALVHGRHVLRDLNHTRHGE